MSKIKNDYYTHTRKVYDVWKAVVKQTLRWRLHAIDEGHVNMNVMVSEVMHYLKVNAVFVLNESCVSMP